MSNVTLKENQNKVVLQKDDRTITLKMTGEVNSISWTSEEPSGSVDGSNKTFTLTNAPNANSLLFYVNGQYQRPDNQDYSLSGDTITMNWAPAEGSTLYAQYQT